MKNFSIFRVLSAVLTALLIIVTIDTGLLLYNYYKPNIEVKPYLKTLQEEALKRGHIVKYDKAVISFVATLRYVGTNVVGLCLKHSGHILVNREHWNRSTRDTKLILLLHELGHCYHGLSHDGSYYHIMNPFNKDGEVLTKELLDDFFKQAYPLVGR